MKKIIVNSPTYGIKEVLVSNKDYKNLLRYRWYYNRNGYIMRSERIEGKDVKILMHRQILGFKQGDGRYADHRDRNKLNNQRRNLREATATQNNRNTTASGLSKYLGVGVLNRNFKGKPQWRANVWINGRQQHLGNFPFTPEGEVAAAKAYDKAAKKHYGKFANLNFK